MGFDNFLSLVIVRLLVPFWTKSFVKFLFSITFTRYYLLPRICQNKFADTFETLFSYSATIKRRDCESVKTEFFSV